MVRAWGDATRAPEREEPSELLIPLDGPYAGCRAVAFRRMPARFAISR